MKKSLLIIALLLVFFVPLYFFSRQQLSSRCRHLSPPPQNINHSLPSKRGAIWEQFEKDYQDWKKRFLVEAGPGKLKVIRPQDGNDTVSEGIAYGMIFSAFADEPQAFAGLWNYAQSKFNQNGLMAWKVKADDTVLDSNSAADADLDMAWALIAAGKQWNNQGYQEAARSLIDKIKRHDVETETGILKPGDGWGGQRVTNPSYFSPAYFELFRDYTGDSDWQRINQNSQAVIDRFYKAQKDSLLLPNWLGSDSNELKKLGPKAQQYGYDATRIPLRQAMAVLIFPDREEIFSPAANLLWRFNQYFECLGPDYIFDGYSVEGAVLGNHYNSAFVGPAATAAIVSENSQYREEMASRLMKLTSHDYYEQSLKLFSLLILSGRIN